MVPAEVEMQTRAQRPAEALLQSRGERLNLQIKSEPAFLWSPAQQSYSDSSCSSHGPVYLKDHPVSWGNASEHFTDTATINTQTRVCTGRTNALQ